MSLLLAGHTACQPTMSYGRHLNYNHMRWRWSNFLGLYTDESNYKAVYRKKSREAAGLTYKCESHTLVLPAHEEHTYAPAWSCGDSSTSEVPSLGNHPWPGAVPQSRAGSPEWSH